MKIGVAKHKFELPYSLDNYLKFVDFSAEKLKEGLFVGPDYALAGPNVLHSPSEGEVVRARLAALSTAYPNLCLVPGTMPLEIEDRQMIHIAPVYINGRETLFLKKTDCTEGLMANKLGLTYKKGPSNPSTFNFNGKKFWLHICGDRDRKPESRCDDADLELILAHDDNSGFHITINTPPNPRYMVLSDSRKPLAQIMKFPAQQFLKASKIYNWTGGTKLNIFETA